jgi:VCBS repeat-containing protein
LKANGILNVIDRDSGDSEVVSQVKTTGVYGVFNIAANGAWAYELNNIASNVQSLLGGQNVSDIFNITTTGGVKQNIVITVSGETSPSIAISSDKKSLKAGDSAIFTFTLTEPSTNFIVSDVTVTGGTLSNFMGSGTSYTALFTPPPNSVIDGIVSIASGVFTDATGKPNADGSDANNTVTISVANLNDAPTGSVSISGTATQRQTLTAANTLADGNGLGTIAYQWMADGVSINGATSSTLTLAQAQVGKVISVSASYIDLGGTSESVTSNATSAVANVNDLPTGAVTIRGTVKSGQTLRAASNIADVDGLGTLNHQWKANGSVITGATYDTLTLTNDLVGKAVSVVVSYTDLSGSNETVASVATSSVLAADDAGVTTPAIRGHVYQWKTHTLLSSVDVVVGQQVSVTNMEGKYQIKPSSMGALSLSVSREMTLIETGNAISSADALAALKIAVGRSPNADGSVATPYQLIAADVNQDGKVTSADALAILKMAVKRSDALPREWLFVSESQDFWGESANNGQGGYTISRTNVAWNKDLQATVTQDTTLNLLAVLKGDVNGSWTGPSTGTQNLQTPYFSDLTSKGLGPLSTWGVVAA